MPWLEEYKSHCCLRNARIFTLYKVNNVASGEIFFSQRIFIHCISSFLYFQVCFLAVSCAVTSGAPLWYHQYPVPLATYHTGILNYAVPQVPAVVQARQQCHNVNGEVVPCALETIMTGFLSHPITNPVAFAPPAQATFPEAPTSVDEVNVEDGDDFVVVGGK
jgi:hypothetical protein